VVTISNLVGAAAQAEGMLVQALDLTGLAQKFGAVHCHLKIARDPELLMATRLSVGQCDVLIGADIVTSASDEALARLRAGHTVAVVNDHETVTGAFTADRDFSLPISAQREAVSRFCGTDRATFVDATRLARQLTGNTIGANVMLLGFACQQGWLPVSAASIEAAIEANGVAVKANIEVFRLGRLLAHDRAAVEALAQGAQPGRDSQTLSETADQLIERRARDLVDYQDAALAQRYTGVLARIAQTEQQARPGSTALREAAARNYYKLLASKDEYEVARLHTRTDFLASLSREFSGDFKIRFHLAPPLLSGTDPATGRPRKRAFGPWILPLLRLLAKGKAVRGKWYDPFGRSAERRAERALIGEYEALLELILQSLNGDNFDAALALAAWPDQIRGFGPVKEVSIAAAYQVRPALIESFNKTNLAVDPKAA
jgi:indolepyruvate ferredoxin oxidoreductase